MQHRVARQPGRSSSDYKSHAGHDVSNARVSPYSLATEPTLSCGVFLSLQAILCISTAYID